MPFPLSCGKRPPRRLSGQWRCTVLVHVFVFLAGRQKAPRVILKTRRLCRQGIIRPSNVKVNYFGAFLTMADTSCRIIQAPTAFCSRRCQLMYLLDDPLFMLASSQGFIIGLVTATIFHKLRPSN